MNLFKKLLTIFIFGFLSNQIEYESEDVLECVLPSGDAFILSSKYEHTPPWIQLIAWHALSREHQEKFKVFYKPKNERSWKKPVNYIDAQRINQEIDRWEICSNYYGFGGFVDMGGIDGQKPPGGSYFSIIDFKYSGTQLDFLKPEYLPELYKKQIINLISDKSQLPLMRPKYYFFGLIEGKLFHEAVLVGHDGVCGEKKDEWNPCLIVAAWQSESTDQGKTWSYPVLTTSPKLFVTGKSIFDQPGIAKPGEFRIGPG
jgi:hypothetical protein